MGSRSYTNLVAHVVWAVKGRLRALEAADDVARASLFAVKAKDAKAELLAVGCAPDHVHVLVRYPGAVGLSAVVQRLKGAAARVHNLEAGDELRWQDGYWAESCDPKDLGAVLAYVEGQRERHRRHELREPWEDHQEHEA